MPVYDDFLAEYARVLASALGGTRGASEAAASIVAGASIKIEGAQYTRDEIAPAAAKSPAISAAYPCNIYLDRAVPVQCPRCSGAGQEPLFMHDVPCEVCAGSGSVSPDAAKAETARREEEIARWK